VKKQCFSLATNQPIIFFSLSFQQNGHDPTSGGTTYSCAAKDLLSVHQVASTVVMRCYMGLIYITSA
jgi:hypothetical protein